MELAKESIATLAHFPFGLLLILGLPCLAVAILLAIEFADVRAPSHEAEPGDATGLKGEGSDGSGQ
ncbi:hypothetical protein [Phenylobacterium montanum]|uniref:Uncharacterized protein n=1 Tax=Phenylobacterium montanum TaxID=2823693 RepID=A0A975G2Q8_9CAUL|nr:hypothetical protein [Caulobacter sp. S6]QUD89514.1 hypothetical protein KCG34_06430 [Caulobacter sp. S6]